MTPVEVIERFKAAGATLRVSDDNLAVDAPKGAVTPDILAALREHKPAIVKLLQGWDEEEAYRLFKAALEATNEAYMTARPAWCHPLFDAIEKAWDAKDMDALRATTQRAVTLAREVIDRSPPMSAEPPSLPKGACYVCGGQRWWRSVHGATVCATCHPPAAPELVAGVVEG